CDLLRDIVLPFGRARKPFVEPADDMFETFDPVPRLPGARELVGLARKLYHHRRHFEKLKGAKHLLATRPGWSARISFTEHEHHRSLHVLNITDGRTRLAIVGIIARRSFEAVRLKEGKVSCVPPVFPARDI